MEHRPQYANQVPRGGRWPTHTGTTLEEVAARLHWTNTKAMWADENIAKGNRFDDSVTTQDDTDDALAEFDTLHIN